MVKVILDRVFSFSRHDDDVFDSRGHALFHHVLNLWLFHHRPHLFVLCFGRGQKARAKSRGRQHRFANFANRARRLWQVSHAFPRCAYFFFAGFLSFEELSFELVSLAAESLLEASLLPPSLESFAPPSLPPLSLPPVSFPPLSFPSLAV